MSDDFKTPYNLLTDEEKRDFDTDAYTSGEMDLEGFVSQTADRFSKNRTR